MRAEPRASRLVSSAAGDYVVRRVDHDAPEDRAAVRSILREYLGAVPGEHPDERYRWLYLDNPCGVARTYLASSADGVRPVGITSLFPRTVQVGGRVLMGAIGGDAFVTPSFRRRGIVRTLHRLACADLDDERLAFMFGPPEPENLSALLQSGAVVTGAARTFTRLLAAPRLGAGFTRAARWFLRAPTSVLRLEPLGERPDPRVDEVWRMASAAMPAGEVIPVRDASFYAWRFGRCVSGAQRGYLVVAGGAPIAAVALERRDERVAIVDVTAAPADFVRVISAVLHASRDADAVDVQIHVPSRRKEIALMRLGFVPRRNARFQVQARESSRFRELITRPSAWSFMWGDVDVDHVL